MKKLIIAGFCSMAALSCSTVQNAKTAQTQHAETLRLKGDWEITSVNYDKGYKIRPFDENADAQCWVGSHWRLIPNNGAGSYQINGGGSCPSVTQPIKFDITSSNEFRFKKLNEGSKAKAVTVGYSLQLVNETTDQFSLVQNVPFNGQNVQVTYNFQRTASALYKK